MDVTRGVDLVAQQAANATERHQCVTIFHHFYWTVLLPRQSHQFHGDVDCHYRVTSAVSARGRLSVLDADCAACRAAPTLRGHQIAGQQKGTPASGFE